MTRLNESAFQILRAEVQKSSGAERLVQVQQDIVLKRLEKLRSSQGSPISLEELRQTVIDIFPNFSEKALKAAARANRPPGNSFSKLKWTAVLLLTSAAGAVGVLSLLYPMVHQPVAQNAPSFPQLSMDEHYQQAIALVEQAERLINQGTTAADLTLGEEKLNEAKKHLEALPVSVSVSSQQYSSRRYSSRRYSSRRYSSGYDGQLTLDQSKLTAIRSQFERMQAQVFQEKQAQMLLTQGEQAQSEAKQQYQQAQTAADIQTAIASWQAAIDQLEQIPSATVASRTAQSKLAAQKRDFEKVAGLVERSVRTVTVIQAAQQFATAGVQAAKNPPHTVDEWEEVARLWEQAIDQIQQISSPDPGYVEAQKIQAKYQRNLGIVRTSLQAEQASVEALGRAKDEIETLLSSPSSDGSSENQHQLIGQLQGIINQLEVVEIDTTAYPKAQELLQSAQKKLEQLQSQ